MLISENLTSENKYDLNIHGIEIKTVKPYRDGNIYAHIYDYYAPFVDYLWIAVPVDMAKVFANNASKPCGIIAIDNNKTVTVVRPASKLPSELRHETLKNIVLKLM